MGWILLDYGKSGFEFAIRYDRYLGEKLSNLDIGDYPPLRTIVDENNSPKIYTKGSGMGFNVEASDNKAQKLHDRIFFVDDKMAFIFGDSFIRFFTDRESTFSTIFRLDEDEYRNVQSVVDRVWRRR